ncbi:hypothetical protein A8709_09260 [Paenibacillus pectinilyticus]|uniref:GmrSD restriction endonucleases N-terminal domain-containing protein n=2 Tax=Paenibacillus pectinilyticus TaxID=512399 RepID=A0A1C1A6A0_9BACL|nr:hypothetical protein A8709_09260 [Paenibacillus pectinilyticus]
MPIQVLIEKIEKGYILQEELEYPLSEEDILKYNDSIIVAPDYQREYRATVKDESSLIESVLIGIPIPPIFLANDKFNGVQVMNVVDGQHRLRAFHRFINNKFTLKELTLLKELEGKSYKECGITEKQQILSQGISAIVFREFPGKEFELEIFSRYNKGTKPLTPQEIRHAVYNSEFNSYVNNFAKELGINSNSRLAKAYNATKDRTFKKKLQESVFVIFYILENGINANFDKSLDYAEDFMERKSKAENKDEISAKRDFENLRKTFEDFNKFIDILSHRVEYPFSREIYGVSSSNYKFQISVAMILSAIFQKLYNKFNKDIDILLDTKFIEKFLGKIDIQLNNSFLERPEYSGSSTNSKEIKLLVDSFLFAIDHG